MIALRAGLLYARRKPGAAVRFTIEFFRIRASDDAHALLDRVVHVVPDLEAAKVRAQSLFETLDMPQRPDGLRILDDGGAEVFAWEARRP
jgi:hypothetical protein